MADIKRLEIGRTYSVLHRRKGHFVGRLLNVVEGDEADPVFLQMEIDVRRGTDQERIANANEATAIKNIRPSLVMSIEETSPENWQRRVRDVPREPPPEVQQAEVLKMAMKLLEQEREPTLIGRIRKRLTH